MNVTGNVRIKKSQEKIVEIDEKIESLKQQKRDLLKQISRLQQEDLYNVVKNSDLSIDELTADLEIGQIIREQGLTHEDIKELILSSDKEKKNEN